MVNDNSTGDEENYKPDIWVSDDNDILVAQDIDGSNATEVRANAHLIAAAPELLEACTAAMNIIEQCIDYEAMSTEDAEKIEEVRVKMSSVVKKYKENTSE